MLNPALKKNMHAKLYTEMPFLTYLTINVVGKTVCGRNGSLHVVVDKWNEAVLVARHLVESSTINVHLFCDSAILILGICPRDRPAQD